MSANGYTYEIRLRDMMTQGFNKALQSSSKFYNKINSDQKKFAANAKRIPKSIAGMEQSLGSLRQRRDNAFDTKTIAAFNRKIRSTEKGLRKLRNLPPLSVGQRIGKLSRSMGGLIGLTGGLAIGMAAFGAIGGIVKLGADLEQTRISFTTMLGSAEKGNALLEDINKFANATPFANSDLQESGKMLLNFGIAGDKVVPTLKRIGDVSGGNKEKLKGLTLAFAQVSSAGKLQGQDLLQMINQGFNPLQEISRTTGKSMSALKDEMSKGGISAKMVEDSFISVTSAGGLFHGMMEKQSQTLGGKWSTLVGKFQDKVAKFGEKLTPYIGRIVDFGIAIVDNIGAVPAYFAAIPETIQQNLDVIIPLGIAVTALSAKYVVGQTVMLAYAVVSKSQAFWTGILTAKQWLLNIALNANPVGLVVAGIAALIAVVAIIIKKYDTWGAALSFILGPFGMIINLVQSFRRHWQSIKDSFTKGGIVAGLKRIGLVMLDSLLMPVQQLLRLASKIPGIGDLAGKGAQKIEDLRGRLGLLPDKVIATELIKKKAGEGISTTDEIANRPIEPTKPPISSNTVDSIATGGKKQTILNIQIDKVLETVNQHVSEGKESADELVDMVLDGLTRRLHGTFNAVGQ